MNPRVSIIIVTYNSREDIGFCLQALREIKLEAAAAGQAAEQLFETIVVDNASGDDSATIVARDFPEVQLIASQQNLGFAGGNNVGLRKAEALLFYLAATDASHSRDSLAAPDKP